MSWAKIWNTVDVTRIAIPGTLGRSCRSHLEQIGQIWWEDAGADTPEWADGGIIYTGPEAAEYTPSIVALVSKLTGNVDPQQIIDPAPGELANLPGWSAMNEGEVSTLGEYPAYQLGGTWESDGQTKIVAQKTVVIPGADGLCILQLNVDGLENQAEVVGSATNVVDEQTTITP
jgi:hypothetical protein